MKAYGGVNVYVHVLMTLALVRGEWSALRSGYFTLGERASGTHWMGGWMDLRVGLDDMEKSKFLTLQELRPLGRPICSQSLYRLLMMNVLVIITNYKMRNGGNDLRRRML
jgi:hypothetical protein